MVKKTLNKVGLVMTGGGARGAYQAGVLKRIGEIPAVQKSGNPFHIMSAASAGAINASGLAAGSDDFISVTRQIAELWSGLEPSDVFRCDVLSQARNSFTWIFDLTFGGALGGGNAHSLLDATPLRHFLSTHVPYDRIEDNIAAGHLYALAVSATNYTSGKSYLFIQGAKGHPMWNRARRVTLQTKITADHICASAAIPLVFQAVKLDNDYFGDGCIRFQQPLSPAIRLGAKKILAIGVRCERFEHQSDAAGDKPSIAQIVGVLLNAIFLDHLSTDVEHLERLNCLLGSGEVQTPVEKPCERMYPLRSLLITPSVDLAELARQHQREMPYLIQYFVNSLGRDAGSCSDLMSYLLFTPSYIDPLLEIGYQDTDRQIDEIEDLLFA